MNEEEYIKDDVNSDTTEVFWEEETISENNDLKAELPGRNEDDDADSIDAVFDDMPVSQAMPSFSEALSDALHGTGSLYDAFDILHDSLDSGNMDPEEVTDTLRGEFIYLDDHSDYNRAAELIDGLSDIIDDPGLMDSLESAAMEVFGENAFEEIESRIEDSLSQVEVGEYRGIPMGDTEVVIEENDVFDGMDGDFMEDYLDEDTALVMSADTLDPVETVVEVFEMAAEAADGLDDAVWADFCEDRLSEVTDSAVADMPAGDIFDALNDRMDDMDLMDLMDADAGMDNMDHVDLIDQTEAMDVGDGIKDGITGTDDMPAFEDLTDTMEDLTDRFDADEITNIIDDSDDFGTEDIDDNMELSDKTDSSADAQETMDVMDMPEEDDADMIDTAYDITDLDLENGIDLDEISYDE